MSQFRENTPVVTADGQDVGRIKQIVVDPATDELTHVVVRQGILFTEDKVLPTTLIDTATNERIVLRDDVDDLEALPRFEQTQYLPSEIVPSVPDRDDPTAPGPAAASYYYPPLGAQWWGAPYAPYPPVGVPRYVARTERHIPKDTIPLKLGIRVLSADGKHVGNVEQVFTDPEIDRVTHFLIAQGLFFKDHKLIPVIWIDTATESELHLSVKANVLRHLMSFEPN